MMIDPRSTPDGASLCNTPSGWRLAWIVIVILGVLAWVLPTIAYLLILKIDWYFGSLALIIASAGAANVYAVSITLWPPGVRWRWLAPCLTSLQLLALVLLLAATKPPIPGGLGTFTTWIASTQPANAVVPIVSGLQAALFVITAGHVRGAVIRSLPAAITGALATLVVIVLTVILSLAFFAALVIVFVLFTAFFHPDMPWM